MHMYMSRIYICMISGRSHKLPFRLVVIREALEVCVCVCILYVCKVFSYCPVTCLYPSYLTSAELLRIVFVCENVRIVFVCENK